jgi:uncharacterized membrane protein YfcA
MHLAIAKVFIGLIVGLLVGLTGIGAGVLLLPLLIFGFRVPAMVAVGSGAVFNAVTKLGSGYLHYRQGTVNRVLVAALLAGSAPGAIAGVALLAVLRAHYGTGVNDFLKVMTGALLITIPALLLFQGDGPRAQRGGVPQAGIHAGVMGVGLLAGFLVGMTSIGSGSVTMLLLLTMFPCSPALIVGTDIVHAVLLTGFTALLHLRLGTVDPRLVGYLLLGSIPGALLGTRLSNYVPGPWLKRILCCALLLTGARMLMI